MKATLLSLPDDVLSRVVNCLLPRSSSDSSFKGSIKHVLSLSETCTRLCAVVIQELHTLDFVAPSSYTSFCCRSTRASSSRIDCLIQSAARYLKVLRLPHGYEPRDTGFSALRTCLNLTELSLPVRKDLDTDQVDTLFSCFSSLEKLTLDLPSPQVLLGLCRCEVPLREVAFTKLPAKTATFNALSSFLSTKGPNLNKLRLDVLTENTKWKYTSSLKGSWIYHEVFMQQEQVILRLSAILGRLSEEKKLSSLRELDISTIPDFPVGKTNEILLAQNQSMLLQILRVVKSAREENVQIQGLQKLRIRVPSQILQPSIAFMTPWINPMIDVTFSLPDFTLRLPYNPSNLCPRDAQLKEVLLGDSPYNTTGAWTDQSCFNFDSNFGPRELACVKTLTFGKHLETIPKVKLRAILDVLTAFMSEFSRKNLKVVRFLSNISSTRAVENIATCLRIIDLIPLRLEEIEFPADIVLFSAAIHGLTVTSGRFVTTVRISDFRNTTILETGEEPSAPDVHHISDACITGSAQKARRFLEGLPKFLFILLKEFPRLETLYMEQTSAMGCIGDQPAISRALAAIEMFERVSKADASTLTTEISEWNETRLPVP